MLLIVLLVLSLALTALYAREGEDGPLHTVQGAVSGAVAPLKFVGSLGGSAVDSAVDAVSDATASPETLSALRDENAQLRERVVQLEEMIQEQQRATELLEMKESYDFSTVAARVVGRSTDAWNQTVTLDAGSAEGVRSGLPVMGGSGLVGMVISATEHSCEVRLITDPESGVAAMVQSSRAEGIVTGSLEGALYFESESMDARIEPGDAIITSGIGGSCFKGLLVGTVALVEQVQGGSALRVVVSQNGSASALEEVLIVTSMDAEGSSAEDEGQAAEGGVQDVNADDDGAPGGDAA